MSPERLRAVRGRTRWQIGPLYVSLLTMRDGAREIKMEWWGRDTWRQLQVKARYKRTVRDDDRPRPDSDVWLNDADNYLPSDEP
jgi:hypothetical protein